MKKLLTIIVAMSFAIITYAQGPGHQKTNINNHPRVNQVNGRIDNQEHRINKEKREGKITQDQAHQDRKNLTAVNQEKRDMRKMDNGHLTRSDQRSLNQQLNQNSQQIGQ